MSALTCFKVFISLKEGVVNTFAEFGDIVILNIAFKNMAHLELQDLGQGFKDNQNTELARVDLINSLGDAVSPSMGTIVSLLEFLDVQGNLIPVSSRGPQWLISLPGGSPLLPRQRGGYRLLNQASICPKYSDDVHRMYKGIR